MPFIKLMKIECINNFQDTIEGNYKDLTKFMKIEKKKAHIHKSSID